MKVNSDSNEFLKGNPFVNVTVKTRREKESMGINEVSPDSSDAFLHTIRTRCS